MQAVTGHDVRLAAENARGLLLHIHQFEKAKLASFVVEEQIDIGILARLPASGRAEQIKMLDPELPQLGLVLFSFVMASSRFILYSYRTFKYLKIIYSFHQWLAWFLASNRLSSFPPLSSGQISPGVPLASPSRNHPPQIRTSHQSRGRNSTSSEALPLAPHFRHRSCRSSDIRRV